MAGAVGDDRGHLGHSADRVRTCTDRTTPRVGAGPRRRASACRRRSAACTSSEVQRTSWPGGRSPAVTSSATCVKWRAQACVAALSVPPVAGPAVPAVAAGAESPSGAAAAGPPDRARARPSGRTGSAPRSLPGPSATPRGSTTGTGRTRGSGADAENTQPDPPRSPLVSFVALQRSELRRPPVSRAGRGPVDSRSVLLGDEPPCGGSSSPGIRRTCAGCSSRARTPRSATGRGRRPGSRAVRPT